MINRDKSALFFSVIMLLVLCAPRAVFAGPPSGDSRLRVLVLAITVSGPKKGWGTPDEVFTEKTYAAISKHLKGTGIYDIIPDRDVQIKLKGEKIKSWAWEKDDWALARQIGKELNADYAMIRERGFSGSKYSLMLLINLHTGRKFEHYDHVKALSAEDFLDIVKAGYREIFKNAKGDLIATAVMKGQGGRAMEEKGNALEINPPLPGPKPPAEVKTRKEPLPLPAPAVEKGKGRVPIVVYDFDAAENLSVIALILAEALREEMSSFRQFKIINRDEMHKVIEEIKLQKSGLIDEKLTVRLGRWLAVKEVITGKLSVLGKTYVLQAKRTDIETLEVFSIASIKALFGKEDDLLSSLSLLSGKLAQRNE